MQHQPHIQIQQLNYTTPDHQSIFRDLTISFGLNKTAIVGKNGIGKTTLLRLMVGELTPGSGLIQMSGRISYCPQKFSEFLNETVSEILGVDQKLKSFQNIVAGSADEKDFEVLNDDWEVEERTRKHLTKFNLGYLKLNRQLKTLSGGELTRLWLAKVFLTDADFLLLDEPTNNLDRASREMLYASINRWQKGMIVISHDRHLLGMLDEIVELSTLGAKKYGGNYELYVAQKKIERASAMRQLDDAKKESARIERNIQKTREKHEQREAKGLRERKSGSQAKIILDSMKERSGKTSGKLKTKEARLLDEAEDLMSAAREKIEDENEIKIDMPKTSVPRSKIVINLEDVSFSYDRQTKDLIDHFSLAIQGSERIALLGNNGSGKTTLIKLILGKVKPLFGSVYVGVPRICYLDQKVELLDENLSIYDNYKILNPDINEKIARINLARFLFRKDEPLKLIRDLSGGEKLRAALACVLTSSSPPQLLILDEPTNHLDLESIAGLESALNCYQGAMIIVSHDEAFLENIQIKRRLYLS